MNPNPRYLLFLAAALAVAGCHGNQNASNPAATQDQSQNDAQDPASANVAPISNASTTYAPSAPASQQGSNAPYSDQAPPPSDEYAQYDNQPGYGEQPAAYAPDPPPPLPEYDQPPCPGDDYLWTPGYWAYDPSGYYWVPGAWVEAPYQGALWTPGYWGYNNGRYAFYHGYWGPHIGYYGGINYGFGYVGFGYQGGYWNDGHFDYNRSVNRVDVNQVHYVYNRTVVVNNTYNRVSYNGGSGGINYRPRPAEIAAIHEQHAPPMTAQVQHVQQARADKANFASVNHGRPAAPVVTRPLTADRNIRPPAHVAMANQPAPQQQQRPAMQQAPQQRAPEPMRPNSAPQPGRANAPQNTSPQRNQANPQPNNHPGNRPEQTAPRPTPQHLAQPVQPAQRPAPMRPTPQPQRPAQPVPPAPRPAPMRPTPQPQHTAPPPQRPQPQPQRSQPQPHPAPQQLRPAPAAHPAPQSKPAPDHKPAPKHDDNRPQ
jgi:hypothetical protein